ncbi:hypothetical protein FACS189487_09500 [Campylobacterota bacterium]|nr:hypothetical protein FACS189487_09500 [Campylobacterota bacterium]
MNIDDFYENSEPRGIDGLMLPIAIAIAIGFAIFMPKIYISNEIYITSLAIDRSRGTIDALQDVNIRLKREKPRY